ncbi:MAG: hypothetical protein SGCHY_000638 [Lobulomycetales sp.]
MSEKSSDVLQSTNWVNLESPTVASPSETTILYSASGRLLNTKQPRPSLYRGSSPGNKSLNQLDARKDAGSKSVGAGLQKIDSVESTFNWPSISKRVMPVFSGDNLHGCVEDLNEMVLHWSRDVNEEEIYAALDDMFEKGVVGLYNKLLTAGSNASSSHSESVLIAARLSELWYYFFGSVVPLIQGAFLPLKTATTKRDVSVDVRNLILLKFREKLVLPLALKIEDALPRLPPGEKGFAISGKIRQMALVLSSLKGGRAASNEAIQRLVLVIGRNVDLAVEHVGK